MAEKDRFSPIWVLDTLKVTSASVADEEILLVENRSNIWRLYWDEEIGDIKLDRLSNARKRFIN